MVNRSFFFSKLPETGLFPHLNNSQMDGIIRIILEWNKQFGAYKSDERWLAYMLATAYHETGKRMQPVKEEGNGKDCNNNGMDDYLERYDKRTDLGNTPAADGDGVLYCGRGLVQITGADNYQKFGTLLHINLLMKPDLALDPEIAIRIMFIGMVEGKFTGKKLKQYFSMNIEDWFGARRIINGHDCAEKIARYGQKFHECLVSPNT